MYTANDPKWVQATSVKQTAMGYVTVTAYGETFENCWTGKHYEFTDQEKSNVLVQNSRGDWLRVWFFDKDVS